MSLKTETKEAFKKLGFDVDKLVAAVTHAEEQDYTLPEINNVTEADLATRDDNSKKEGIKEGKKNGISIATKAVAEKFNIPITEIDLSRPETLVDKLNANFAKGDEGLKEQVRLLQADVATAKGEKDTAVKEAKQAGFDMSLIAKLPANRSKLLTDAEHLNNIKFNLQFDEEDGKPVVKRNGAILRDATTKDPLPYDKAIEGLFTERKWVDEGGGNGGRGGGDNSNNGAGGIKKLSQFIENWEKEGKNPMSPEFHTALAAAAKATTDFDMAG